MKSMNPNSVCEKCAVKKTGGFHKCPMEHKWMCPDYQAYIAEVALEYQDTALQIPVESLITALRYHGYAGELRKTGIVTI